MGDTGRLTTTSYAMLGLLALRSWSTYELAKQLERSLNNYWPRAESKLYEEPKKLVALGLATAREEHTGKRARTLYDISDAGREALRCWLTEVGETRPRLEFEALVRVCFAENGTTEDLLRLLREVRHDADAFLEYGALRADEYRETGGPFPERLHVIALVSRFLYDYHRMIADWAEWAEAEVGAWADMRSVDKQPLVTQVFDADEIRRRRTGD